MNNNSSEPHTSIYDIIKVAVLAEVRLPVATAELDRIALHGRAHSIRTEPATYRLDLSFTARPRNARACYRERWGPHRFEQIGRMYVWPPNETIESQTDDTHCEQTSVICYLRPEPLREWFDGDLVWTDRRLAAGLDIQCAPIRNLMVRLADELREPGFATHVLVGLITSEIAIELGRYCTSIRERHVRGGLAPWRLRMLDERLNELGAPPTLSELAQLCNLSVRALTRGFRESRGVSLGQHVTAIRVQHAMRLLTRGESTKSVALALGFGSSPAFCYAFRRATGETPTEFRARTFKLRC